LHPYLSFLSKPASCIAAYASDSAKSNPSAASTSRAAAIKAVVDTAFEKVCKGAVAINFWDINSGKRKGQTSCLTTRVGHLENYFF